jgi:thiol:disulfide interchange protein
MCHFRTALFVWGKSFAISTSQTSVTLVARQATAQCSQGWAHETFMAKANTQTGQTRKSHGHQRRSVVPKSTTATTQGKSRSAAVRPASRQSLFLRPQSLHQQDDQLIIDLPRNQADFEKPAQLTGVLALADGSGIEITAVPGPVAAAHGAGWGAILAALGGALLGGLLLNIMPCVFPVISLKALSLAKGGGTERAARQEALAYAAGVVLTCLAMGGLLLGLRASGQAVGWAFQLQQPVVILFLLLVAVAITLNLAGLFELRGLGDDGGLTGKKGNAGAFWTGVLAAFVATPCTGPFMAAALGAALVLPVAAALAIFAGLGLGMALPFLLLGFAPAFRRMMPRPGAWMVWFRRVLALPMALTAAALVWLLWRQTGLTGALVGLSGTVILAVMLWIKRQSFLSPLLLAGAMLGLSLASWPLLPKPQAAAAMAGTEAFNEARLAALRKAGQPVFLYFTADWCLTCKVNEKAAIERPETIAHFKTRHITVMAGDWSRNDPAITRFLEAQGRSGVPLYLFYPAGGGEPVVLPQILTVAGLAVL